jgi:hypothetical protein
MEDPKWIEDNLNEKNDDGDDKSDEDPEAEG